MTDHLTKDKRSWNMSRIRSRHTKPELILRSLLHRSGFRFRINYNKLPGSPDIVLPKYKTVIFVHGCFWHRHPNCSKATTPNTNRPYWKKKFDKNVSRDIEISYIPARCGWQSIVLSWAVYLCYRHPEQANECVQCNSVVQYPGSKALF